MHLLTPFITVIIRVFSTQTTAKVKQILLSSQFNEPAENGLRKQYLAFVLNVSYVFELETQSSFNLDFIGAKEQTLSGFLL